MRCFCCCPIAKRGGDKVVELHITAEQLLYDKSNLYQRQSQVSFFSLYSFVIGKIVVSIGRENSVVPLDRFPSFSYLVWGCACQGRYCGHVILNDFLTISPFLLFLLCTHNSRHVQKF